VDYITKLRGGVAIPGFLKEYRGGKQYLFLGLRMTRDTERMVLSDIIYAAGNPAGWVLIPKPNDEGNNDIAEEMVSTETLSM
jgi:hypothetical protein